MFLLILNFEKVSELVVLKKDCIQYAHIEKNIIYVN